ncbi:Respiratory-chain NADH dehydrogenase 51 Kd subunit [[Eubacterium] yurii subsp. margaretiae ATCC 43715]|nr:Respiratory-chain NADH dehydrogenase 51 Kd subunit [[Eubacterium] yurii subsp. margaretiae ATCC 43715]
MSLLDKIKSAGVVGAGGAGFPTHVKLASKADYILMNAAECEPLLRVDQQIMDVYCDDIIHGFEMAGRLVEAKKAIIGIKYKHKQVIQKLRQRISELDLDDYISVNELKDVYPAGDEQVLVYELTGRVVPEMGIPLNVGCVVVNSETCLNIYNSMNDVAVTDSYVTIAGDIDNPCTLKVPVGTPLMKLFELVNIRNIEDYGIIDGGPMMGPLLSNLESSVTKKSKGYILLKKEHSLIKNKGVDQAQAKKLNRGSCEQCRMCTDLCPRYLLGHNLQPHKMVRTQAYNIDDLTGQQTAQLCVQCNLCELFSCPIGIKPMHANNYFRAKLLNEGIKYSASKEVFEVRNNRDFRLVPTKRLIARLGLYKYDRPAPLLDKDIDISQVKIATRQHVGAPAKPIVSVGDNVVKGQLIGIIQENSLGANIHSSINGVVVDVNDNYITIRRD